MRKTYAAQLRNALSASSASGHLASDLAALSEAELEFLTHDWQVWARDEQLTPYFAPGDSPTGEPAAGCGVAEHLISNATNEATMPAPSGRLAERESEGATWKVWLLLGGRGSGKTRAGAEWVRSVALGEDFASPSPLGERVGVRGLSSRSRNITAPSSGLRPPSPQGENEVPRLAAGSRNASRQAQTKNQPARIALVGKTIHDVRNVMVEGVSGLLAIHPARERPMFEPSKRKLTWPNGAIAELFSADECEALRGPQFSHAWCDELAKWRGAEAAWDMLQFGLRLGDNPQTVVTTTPRPSAFLKKLMRDAATATVHLATADNADNLAPMFLAEMTRRYAGSVIGRQELLGELVEESSESLWRRSWIEEARIDAAPEMRRVIVAIDPPVTSTARSDACGIVVAGLGIDGRSYVLADRTIQGRTPDVWAKAAVAAYNDFSADALVAEVNQGGDLVIGVVQQHAPNVPVMKVRATRGKWVRAEPVASLYAEGRVVHVGRFDALEDQLVAFGVDGTVKGKSPDRADALVWAITELLFGARASPQIRML